MRSGDILQPRDCEKLYMTIEKSILTYESEKEWLAMEVHDRLIPNITAVFYYVQSIELGTLDGKEMRDTAGKCVRLCRDTIIDARNVMRELCPPVLNNLSLIEAIREDVLRIQSETCCSVNLDAPDTLKPGRVTEIVLYRIVHEALSNAAMHSMAEDLSLRLAFDKGGNSLTVTVKDNGCGFDLMKKLEEKPLGGLIGMQRRAQSIGGICTIKSKPGRGTNIIINVPLKRSTLLGNFFGGRDYEKGEKYNKCGQRNYQSAHC